MLKDLIIDIIGTYEPVTYDGVALNGSAGVDWTYIGAIFVLCICMYSVWRLIGGVFK